MSHSSTRDHEPRYRSETPGRRRPTPRASSSSGGRRGSSGCSSRRWCRMATRRSFVMLDPAIMARNPVMFLVEVGSVLTSIVAVQSIVNHAATGLIVYQAALAVLLLLTVLFANFAEALAEARGKAQADSLRQTRADTPALRLDSADGAGRPDRLLDQAPGRRPRRGRGRPGDPDRRRGRRGRGVGRRVGDHRRERPGDPRGRRRPLGRHRRHPRPLRPDRHPGHRRARRRASSTR